MKIERQYYKVYEAAKILGVGAATVRKMIKSNHLVGAQFGDKPNSPYFVSIESVERYINIDNKIMLQDKLEQDHGSEI